MTSSNEVLEDGLYNMVVGIRNLRNLTPETAESNVIVIHNVNCSIFTLELQAKTSKL